MEEVIERLGDIEVRLSRIEGGLMLAAFLLGLSIPLAGIIVAVVK